MGTLGIEAPSFEIKKADKTWYAETEVFVEATVQNLRLWIYEDGAHIRGVNINKPFEAQDYKNEDELVEAFVEKVIQLVNKKQNQQI